MKKNLLMAFLFSGVIIVLLGIFINKSEILPNGGEDFTEMVKEDNSNIRQLEPKDSIKTIQDNEKLKNDDCEFVVLSSLVSKKLNDLNKVNVEDYVSSDVKVDSENTFLDDHLYLQIELLITNLKDTDYPIVLSNIQLFTEENNELFNITDISLTNTVDSVAEKDSFHLTLKPNEEKKVYLGYIITEEQYQEAKEQLYILPDLSGILAMNPELLIKIKLEVVEVYE